MRVLILQADELEQSHTPHQRAELVRQLRERSAIAPSFALIWAKLGQKKQSYVPGAGELDFHSCAVSQLLVSRRHRFGICVPETQSPLEVLCHRQGRRAARRRILVGWSRPRVRGRDRVRDLSSTNERETAVAQGARERPHPRGRGVTDVVYTGAKYP